MLFIFDHVSIAMMTKLEMVLTLEERQAWDKQQLDISKAEKSYALATISRKQKVKVASVGKKTVIHMLSTVEDCEAFWPGVSLDESSKIGNKENKDA